MVGFDDIRGDGLTQAHRDLIALDDPQILDRARRRFSHSPPSYTSHQSHNSTLSNSLNPISEDQQREEERQWKLKREQDASRPYQQLQAQEEEERTRVERADHDGSCRQPVQANFDGIAYENVKQRWVAQGIWNDKWYQTAMGAAWKHEEPLQLEPEAEVKTIQPIIFASLTPPRDPRLHRTLKWPTSDEEERQQAEQQSRREREREASRPFHQFLFQVSKEVERSLNLLKGRLFSDHAVASPDINTKAYGHVKSIWIKRRIWNRQWGVLPGMSWKHELPLEELTAADDQVNGAEDGDHQPEEPPSPFVLPFAVFPGPEGHQTSDMLATSQHGLANGNNEHTLSQSDSASPQPHRVIRPKVGQATRSNGRGSKQRNADLSLGQVSASKVSKPSTRTVRHRRPPNVPEDSAPTAPPPVPDAHMTESQPRNPRAAARRSERLRQQDSAASQAAGADRATDPVNSRSRTKPTRTTRNRPALASLGKPQRVSKKQPARAAQRRKRKDAG